MLSASTRAFLSHPIEEPKNLLITHLLEVGKSAENIFSETNFTNTSLAFYSGLLHDIGKINPFYQEIFYASKSNRDQAKETALENYVQEHSRFSARVADIVLQNSELDDSTIEKILVLIYGHHSTIRKTLGEITDKNDKFLATQTAISASLSDFSNHVIEIPELAKFDWNKCAEKFLRPLNFDVNLESEQSPDDYLEMSCAFSCLLQADRGSFASWIVPNFDLNLNTQSLVSNSPLAITRTEFQQQVMEDFDADQGISIINAPTGIGKTKVFLDIINQYSEDKDVQRIFYFSPLLALTEDFESKIASVISKKQQEDILIYNHLFSGSLQDKRDENTPRFTNRWVFENESFNKKFVITTTQRLLMTLFSNKTRDKLKMASFRNSILIIDEVQTIPKPILFNLKSIFKQMHKLMGTRFILVSATIPHEISDLPKIELSSEMLDGYLELTKKQISIAPLNIPAIPFDKTLVMGNTRKKAVTLFSQIQQSNPNGNLMYISAGIKKRDRIQMIKDLKEQSNYVLVATQVVEAGVDISFSHVYREQAPLDNIIQVMGRLNREGTNPDARLVIYPTDGEPIPYSPLEYQVTQEMIQNVTSSIDIYAILEQYYAEISTRNATNAKDAQELQRLIARMDFEKVWEFVQKMAFQEDSRETVFIPDDEQYDEVRNELLTGLTKDNFKKFGNLTASLPISLDEVGVELFDEQLREQDILLPKREHLDTIYDQHMGLDRWLLE